VAAGRPTKFSDVTAGAIIDRLRAGCTRRAAAESVGVDESTLSKWISGKSSFSSDVARAESEAEAKYALILQKAASGWDAGSTTRTTKTVFKTRTVKHPDGRVVEEPVALQEVTESVKTERQFDWRAALEWLKRRRAAEWGDSSTVRFEKMTDEQLVEYVTGLPLAVAAGGPDSPGDREASRASG
jgi:transcriptional regulator with XRE-family HTH domain